MSCPWKLERPTVGGHQHHDGGGRVPRAGPAACFGRIAGIEHASSTASTESPCTVLPVYLCTWVGRALLTPPFSLDAKKAWPCAAHVSVPQCCSLSRSLVHILDHFTPKRSGRAATSCSVKLRSWKRRSKSLRADPAACPAAATSTPSPYFTAAAPGCVEGSSLSSVWGELGI